MPKVSLVGRDAAGATIAGPGATNWTWNGAPMSLVGDAVVPHGNAPHSGPVMVEGSPWFTIAGIPVVRAGSAASCGHTASGSADMDIP